ncbi:hypothetical protein [Gimesia fumaroli]|uniref:Uncharacterized protein n=1 Tax=Gimesia fumaroli TaxID=2527976 RepID=A0A518IL97_9PLAN|nr:hypothetical protein [Gimesia fumaroli]QDV53785.1 hypothetical protein Enr17x_58680 [Gimesia fumaroli]
MLQENEGLIKSLLDQRGEESFDSMYGLRVEGDRELSEILKPIQQMLDDCWWYLGGAGVTLPLYLGNASAEMVEKQSLDYANFLDDESDYRVGKPGWFARYIDHVDACWDCYFACESLSSEKPRELLDRLDALDSKGRDDWWFGDVTDWSLPDEVVLVCRDVDAAYWDLFFRDKNDCTIIEQHLQQFDNIQCTPFVEPPVG